MRRSDFDNVAAAVPVAGGTLSVTRRAGDGPALVLLHYWGGSAATWEPLLSELTGPAALRFDQRGWGSSRALPGPFDLDALASDALAVASALAGDGFVLCGHSMGGKVAQLVAAERPAGLRGLALVAPAPPRPLPIDEATRVGLSHAYDDAGSVAAALDGVLTARPLAGAVRERVIADSLAAAPGARAEWPLRGIVRDISERARRIAVPTLVVAGEHDRVEPPAALQEHLLDVIDGAELTVLPGAGHLLELEAPRELAAVLSDFWSRLARSTSAGPRR